jgi:meso-butanediol dehydrogenase / (S,S)-butanediol dehydrogenase / diacetyl reductase
VIADRFAGRTALVTGGASGIGRATALRLASEGATVVAVDVNAELLSTLSGGKAVGSVLRLVGNVGSETGVQQLVGDAVERLGHLDVVINAAGVLSFAHSHEHTLAEWERVIAINLTGTFLVCRYVLPHVIATRGNIVNVASVAAHRGQPWAAAYGASKGGVLALTRALAVEYAAKGVRVNSVSPGAIDTPMTGAFVLPEGADVSLINRVVPIGPFGNPEGVAAAIAYIASDEAAHMNGADLVIDGATLA